MDKQYREDIWEALHVFNPLLTDLGKMTEDQLLKKVEELQNFYFMSPSKELQSQIIDLLDVYQAALQEKQIESYKKEIIEGQANAFDDLINIK